MDMLLVGTETNFKPPFCKTMTPPPGGGCVKPRHWDTMTLAQSRSQMSLWTIMKSPLLISADLTNTDSTFVDVLANTEVLAVNDDPLGNEARRLGDSGYADKSVGEIYAGTIANGSHAVVMFNRNSMPTSMTLEIADVTTSAGGCNNYKVRDLWAHTDNGTVSCTGSVTAVVGGFDVVMITLRPSSVDPWD
jgi:hypothetical protein